MMHCYCGIIETRAIEFYIQCFAQIIFEDSYLVLYFFLQKNVTLLFWFNNCCVTSLFPDVGYWISQQLFAAEFCCLDEIAAAAAAD